MLQEQNVPINFGQGVETKSDPKAVIPGKFLRAENGVFTNPERFLKRNGYTTIGTTIAGGGNLASPKMIHGFNDELLVADNDNLYTYSSTQSAWIDKGNYVSTELTRQSIDQSTNTSGYNDSIVIGNIAIYAWSSIGAAGSSVSGLSSVYVSVVDLALNAVILAPTLQSSYSGVYPAPVKAILLGGTVPAIAYLNTAGNAIVMRIITLAGSGVVTFGSELTITTAYMDLGSSPRPGSTWDIAQTATGAVIFYGTSTGGGGVSISTINTSGAVTNTASIADAAAIAPVRVSVNSFDGKFWVYWCDFAGTADIQYAIYNSTLGAPFLAQTFAAGPIGGDLVPNFISTSDSATHQTLYYSFYYESAVSSPAVDSTDYVVNDDAGTLPTVFGTYCKGVTPFSNPVTIGTSQYAVFVYRGAKLDGALFYNSIQDQPTYFLLKLGKPATPFPPPVIAARFGYGLANTQAVLATVIGYTPNLIALSATKISFSVATTTSEQEVGFFSNINLIPDGEVGSYVYNFDFNGPNTYIPTNCCDVALLNGGLVHLYDGASVSEFGFHLFPEVALIFDTPNAGGITAGTYSYIVIFQWIDDLGNLHQSAPSKPSDVTFAATSDVTLYISLAYLTHKSKVTVGIFRTTNGGNVYYRVNDATFTTNVSPSDPILGPDVFYVYTDILNDADITGNLQAYTYPSSSVLENGTPPPSMVILAHNDRGWLVDAENTNTEWYTKSYSPGTGLSPSPFMTQTLDPKFGEITALAEMDEKLVTIKKSGIFVQSGDGVNDVGSDSTLSFPQFVPSDVGCSELKSLVVTPTGVMFKSLNGIYILSRSLNVAYLGAEVEQYNSQVITSAEIIVGKSQIRFLCSTGLTLVYDYIFNKWATFTNHTGISASNWMGTYVYLRTNGVIYKETPGTYTDNATAYSLLLQTSWLAFAGIQGFQRVRRLIMLGDYANGASASHGISVSAAYDFSTTFQNAISYLFGAAASSGVFQYRERLPIQKCDSVSLLIQEVTTGSSSEYIDLTNMSFEVGVKKGVNKLGGTKSVG